MTIPGHRFPLLLLILLGIPVLLLLWLGIYAVTPGPLTPQARIEVTIPPRTGLSTIAGILAENRVIRDDFHFSVLVVLTGNAGKLQAGEYGFAPGQTPLVILDRLKKGDVLYRGVTIPEGTDMEKIAAILAADGWVDRDRFRALARDKEIIARFGIAAESLEGYLFPDTYYLSRGQQDEEGIIAMMVTRHFQVYDEIAGQQNTADTGLSHQETVTLASIVEKETANPEERGLIAGVFLNRLEKSMRLQADPTVRYGLDGEQGPLTRSDLQTSTPYNTYIHKGLPPGPITNPGRDALVAAIYPVETEYLYFVAKGDASHHFSKTLEEHNRAVSRYRSMKQ
jgi:UPF0755 protein